MSLREKAIKGVIWSAAESWGQQFISLLVFFFLARLLGPEALGLVALANVFMAFVSIFVDQGFSQAIVQKKKLEPGHLDTAFWTSLVISFLLTTFSLLSAGWVASFFKEPELAPLIRWLSISLLLSPFNSVQQAILQRELDFKTLAKRSLVATFLGGIVGLTMALLGFGVWSIVGQSLSNSLIQVLILWRISNWRPGFRGSIQYLKELFSFGINIVGISILNFVTRHADDFLIGYFLGSEALGYYSVAYKLLLVVTQLMISTVHKVAMPVFSRLQEQPKQMKESFYNAIEITNFLSFPVFCGMIVLSPELIITVFGDAWLQCIPVMRILCLIGFLYGGFYFNNPLMVAMGKPSWSFWLKFGQAVGNVAGFAIAVHWGIVAVAGAYIIRAYLMVPVTVWAIYKLINISLPTYISKYTSSLIPSSIMMIFMFGLSKFFSHANVAAYLSLILCSTVGVLVYVSITYFTSPHIYKKLISLLKVATGKEKSTNLLN